MQIYAEYENTLKYSDKNSMSSSKVTLSKNGKKRMPYHASFFHKCHSGFRFLH